MSKAREAAPTVACVDDYCAHYRSVFTNGRHFEQFTHLELGLLAETKRKSLPRLAKTAKSDHPALQHFLANANWPVNALRSIRLRLTREALAGRPFILCIDETGDRKKGKKGKPPDYAASQYIGNLHGLANGVVSVNAYGVRDTVTFPLAFRVDKPKSRLKAGDTYRSKPQLAIERVQELHALGLRFSVVLADSLYGESGDFLAALQRLGLPYGGAMRSNHGVWMFPGQPVRRPRWRPCERIFTDGSTQQRLLRETVFGHRHSVRYFQITTDPATLPAESTWDRMTNRPGKIERTVGNTFGLRTWIEYGFKQAEDELGWADYRLTEAARIERWWELGMCAYLLVSLPALGFAPTTATDPADAPATPSESKPPVQHPAWTNDGSGKHRLNTLRLLLQPFVCACFLVPWLRLYPLPHRAAGLTDLCALMNTYHPLFPP